MVTTAAERREATRNAATAYLERFLLLLSALLLTPYLFRELGVAGFGTWSVMFTVTTVFVMLEEGFASGIVALVADLRSRGRRADLEETVAGGVLIMGATGAVALLATAAIATAADGLAPPAERDAFRTGMLVLGGAVLLRLPLAAYGAALIGHQRYDLYNAAQATVTLTFVAGAVLAVESGSGVFGVAVAQAAALVIGAVLFVVLMRGAGPSPLRLRRPSAARVRQVLSFSSFALVAQSAGFVGQRIDTVIVAALRSAAAAAPIAAAAKLQSGLQALTLPWVNLLLPMTADLRARGRLPEIVRRLELATRVSVQITLPMAAGVALFAHDIARGWLGADAPAVTGSIIALLALQTLFLAVTPAEKVLVGLARVRAVSALNVLEGLVNLALTITLVVHLGAVGAALGSLVASATLGPLKWPVACRAVGQPTLRFLRRSVVPGVVAVIPALAGMGVVRILLDAGNLRAAIGFAVGLGLLALVSVAQLGGRAAPARVRATLRSETTQADQRGRTAVDLEPAPVDPARS